MRNRSHLRRFKVGNVVGVLERKRVWKSRCLHPIERRSIERLSGAHAEGAIVRSPVVVLVEEVVGVDIVRGCRNGGIHRSHSEKLVRGMLEERRERRKWVV
jgi:hypothetical protein